MRRTVSIPSRLAGALALAAAAPEPGRTQNALAEILRRPEFFPLAIEKWMERLSEIISRHFAGSTAGRGFSDLLRLLDNDYVRNAAMVLVIALFLLIVLFTKGLLGRNILSLRAMRERALSGGEKMSPLLLELQAEELAGRGEFLHAMKSLYIAFLLHLSARNVLRFDPARTNREIERTLRAMGRETLVRDLMPFNRMFESRCYAMRPCSGDDFIEFRGRYEHLRQAALGVAPGGADE